MIVWKIYIIYFDKRYEVNEIFIYLDKGLIKILCEMDFICLFIYV